MADYYVLTRTSDNNKALYSAKGAILASWSKERGIDMDKYVQEQINLRAFSELGNLHGDVVVEDRTTSDPAPFPATIEIKAPKVA